ncbi:O-antigen ligase family protein [Sphingobium aromaticiconvertens]|uniref:O-antigen ligase family protein n=1 Tax=Sphingobium aromaticiconvertens TaxID=365341 RepID=UPI003019D607
MTKAHVANTRIKAPVSKGLIQASFFLLLLLSLLSPFMILSDLPGMGENSLIRQVAYPAITLLLLIAIRPDSNLSNLTPIAWPLLAALGWCWLSLAWSIDRGASLSHLILTSIILWGIFVCVTQLRFEQILLLVRVALVLLVALNFIVLLFDPSFAIHQSNDMVESKLAGDWRGMMMHKNYAGAVMAMTILFFTFHARTIWMPLRLAVIGAAAVFLYYSTSKTSTGMVITALVIGLFLRHYHFRYRPVMVILLMILGIGAVTLNFIYRNPLKEQWSNPDAFTGRTLIWDMLLRYWQDHFWLGSGFGAFWNTGSGSPVYSYATGWVTGIGTGHNGYLDLLAQTGLIGAVIIIMACLLWPLTLLLLGKRSDGEQTALLTAIMVFCIGHNFTESSIFDRDAIMNLFLLLTVGLIVKGERKGAGKAFDFRFKPADARGS